MGKLADLVELPVVHRDPHAPGRFWDDHQQARICRSRVLESPAARYWLRVTSTTLAKVGFMRWGREVTGELPSGTEISKGIKDQDPKSVVDVENMGKFAEHTTQLLDGRGGPFRVI